MSNEVILSMDMFLELTQARERVEIIKRNIKNEKYMSQEDLAIICDVELPKDEREA